LHPSLVLVCQIFIYIFIYIYHLGYFLLNQPQVSVSMSAESDLSILNFVLGGWEHFASRWWSWNGNNPSLTNILDSTSLLFLDTLYASTEHLFFFPLLNYSNIHFYMSALNNSYCIILIWVLHLCLCQSARHFIISVRLNVLTIWLTQFIILLGNVFFLSCSLPSSLQ
jgi:hypothetical protein